MEDQGIPPSKTEGVHPTRDRRTGGISHPPEGESFLSPGKKLGDFTILEVIGLGAMGVVYRARQESLGGREVALKVLRRKIADMDPGMVGRFRREASLASEIHHPNIAELYGAGSEGETLFFAMRLIEGPSLGEVYHRLSQERRRGGTLYAQKSYIRRAAELVRDVAWALGAIHSKKLIHRDVKPANILLEGGHSKPAASLEGRPILVDFGLIRPVENPEFTRTGVFLGTPVYASPEARLGRNLDPRADVFSLGAVLFDLLTLNPREDELFASQEIRRLRAVNPAVDARLAAVLEMALQEKPGLRYADGNQFARDLDAYLHDEPLRARPASPIGRLLLWARRHPASAAKTAAGLLLTLALVIFLTWAGSKAVLLYKTASRAAKLEAEGDLEGAALAFRPLLENQALAALLPGLSGETARAARYWNRENDLAALQAALRSGEEKQIQEIHKRLHELLLTRKYRKEWLGMGLRFLAWEIELFCGGNQVARGEWAARTLSHYLQIHPFPIHPKGVEKPRKDRIEGVLLKALEKTGRRPGRTESRLYLLSSLTGVPTPRTFEVFLDLLSEEDPESQRMGFAGASRIFWSFHLQGALRALPGRDLVRWAEWTWKRHQEYLPHAGRDDQAKLDLFSYQIENNLSILSLVEREIRKRRIQPPPGWGSLPIHSLLDFLERTLFEGERPPLEELRPEVSKETVRKIFRFHPHFAVEKKSFFQAIESLAGSNRPFFPIYENIWDEDLGSTKGSPKLGGSFSAPSPRRKAAEAFFNFEKGIPGDGGIEPSFEGAAESAVWRGVEFQNLSQRNREDFPQGGKTFSLVFYRPGRSFLEVTSLVPSGAEWADIEIKQLVGVRSMAPFAGRAKVRFSILPMEGFRYGPTGGKGAQSTERTYLGRSGEKPSIHVEKTYVEGKRRLRFRVDYLDGDTTWRIAFIKIVFHFSGKEKKERKNTIPAESAGGGR